LTGCCSSAAAASESKLICFSLLLNLEGCAALRKLKDQIVFYSFVLAVKEETQKTAEQVVFSCPD